MKKLLFKVPLSVAMIFTLFACSSPQRSKVGDNGLDEIVQITDDITSANKFESWWQFLAEDEGMKCEDNDVPPLNMDDKSKTEKSTTLKKNICLKNNGDVDTMKKHPLQTMNEKNDSTSVKSGKDSITNTDSTASSKKDAMDIEKYGREQTPDSTQTCLSTNNYSTVLTLISSSMEIR